MPKGEVMTTVATPPARDSRPTRVRSALWPARYVPWSGRADRLDVVLLGAFLGVVAFGLAIRPLKPFLLASHPELLGLLTGDLIPIGAGAAFARVGDASLWLVVVTGAVGMVKFDWLMWWAGRRWGVGILRMFTTPERAQQAADRATTLDPRILRLIVAVSFLPGIPSPVAHATAGMAGMRLRTFLLLDLVGALVMTGLVAGLGYGLGQRAVDVVLMIDRYATLVTLTLISLTLLLPMVKRWITRFPRSRPPWRGR